MSGKDKFHAKLEAGEWRETGVPTQPETPSVEECAGCRWWDRIYTTETGICSLMPPTMVQMPARTYETTSGYERTDAARVDQVRPRMESNERCGQWRTK